MRADTGVGLSSAPVALDGSGDYWVKRRRVAPSRMARDDARAEALWAATARLTGLDADRILRDAMAHAVA
jgi:hypothetical protein